MDYTQLEDYSDACPSAKFEDDNNYCDLMNDLIMLLDDCTHTGYNMIIEGPMQTRILLDWLCEARRRFYVNKKQNKHKYKS